MMCLIGRCLGFSIVGSYRAYIVMAYIVMACCLRFSIVVSYRGFG